MGIIELGNFGTGSSYLYMFIFTIVVVWITLVFFSYRKYGFYKTLRYFMPMFVASLFLEASAVASGRYIYPGYFVYLNVIGGSVPLIILLGWSANLFIFLKLSEQTIIQFNIKKNYVYIILVSLLTGIYGMLLDMLEDPLAHHNNWWVWTETTNNSAAFFGVPFSNFFDWFIILFYFALATQLIERSGLTENRKLLISFFSVSFIGVAIFATHTLFIDIL